MLISVHISVHFSVLMTVIISQVFFTDISTLIDISIFDFSVHDKYRH